MSGAPAPDGPLPLAVHPTPIPGLLVVDLPVHGDNRGWFKENWQREKMTALGLPDFGPVQQNVSFNGAAGTTRGLHAEPWDKYVSVATGRVFGAWVDLRDGEGFGRSFTIELGPDRAAFVPRGVANGYQTLEPDTAYAYLVNGHWRADAPYTFLNLADPTAAIAWPIPLEDAERSVKDLGHPMLDAVEPVTPRQPIVVGSTGQLARALRVEYPDARFLGRDELDLSVAGAARALDASDGGAIIVAAAHTDVDGAESDDGRRLTWRVNAGAVAELADVARDAGIPLVVLSSDYVFDGTRSPHPVDEPHSPLGVYGQTKAAAELAARTAPRHYVVRTSWVVGDGANFVRTMRGLAERGVDPAVVDDQFGRLTFADELARGIRHLLDVGAAPGVYHLTGGGEPASWLDVAGAVFELAGHDPRRVSATSTEAYAAGRAERGARTAPRPRHSVLDLARIEATGFVAEDWRVGLARYLAG